MTQPEPPPASLRLRIDKTALANNWRALDRMSGAAEAGAAVKANAYGLGTEHVLPSLLDAGARQFFVAHWSEVADVLAYTPGNTIAVLHGVSNAEEAAYARATSAIPVINTLAQAQTWHESGGGACHLMVDTGINRLGVSPADIGDPAIAALEIDTLLSHLASADEDSDKNTAQMQAFHSLAGELPARRYSLANSAGIALGGEYHFDLTRPGLALYGGVPRPELATAIRQVLQIEAAVLQIRDVSAGDEVGYNAKWKAKQPTRVATISLGYADGILRVWGKFGALHHGESRLPILGRVSMDMITVDCTGTDLAEGDYCRLSYDLPRVSENSGMSQYELLTVLGERFQRVG